MPKERDAMHSHNDKHASSSSYNGEGLDAMIQRNVQQHLDKPVPPALARKLGGRIDAFGTLLGARRRRPLWQCLLPQGSGWAYSLAMILLVIALAFFTFGGNTPPTWAEVAERFSTVDYVHATIYVKSSPLESITQSELWLQEDGKIRFRAGNAMLFGDVFNIHTIIPFTDGERLPSDPLGAQDIIREVIEEIGQAQHFSLEVLVQALPMEGALSAPLPNENASISKDLIVFDFAQEAQDDWLRIWALRDSRLPVRLTYWNPTNGESIDVVLSYAGPQPAEFFDADAFRAHLAEHPDDLMHWAYGLMRDVDGQPMITTEPR